MDKELHLFIIWHNAYNHRDEILSDIEKSFSIRNIFEIKWSEKYFNSNLTRFYGTSLPKGCGKEQHIGRDKFLLVIVEVKNPTYENRTTSHGDSRVCIDMFDKKQQYRDITAGEGSHMIHATDNTDEFNHDLTLLIGLNKEDYIKKYKKSKKVISLEQDLPGAEKWKDLNELFYVLNTSIDYVVLRDFENDLNELFDEKSDADILAKNANDFMYVCNGEMSGNNIIVNVNNKKCLFDVKDFNDNYYSLNMAKDIISNRIINGFYYIPNQEYHYYSCLYHALFHKNNFETEYNARLENVFGNKIHNKNNDKKYYINKISEWMKNHNYDIAINTKDIKKNNIDNIKLSSLCNEKLLEEYNSFIAKQFDFNTYNYEDKIAELIKKYPNDYEEAFKEDSSWPIVYSLSNLRKNVISWYPFKKDCTILEIGAEMGAITDELCKHAKKVTSIEPSPKKAGIIKLRNKNNKNLEVISEQYKNIEFKDKYDYIVLNGTLAYSEIYMDTDNPTLDFLNDLKSHLNKDGKILLSIENKYGLKYWCGANEDHTGIPFDGIKNDYSNSKIRTFSKKELEDISKEVNMHSNFYYMFPDYKFLKVVYTDKSLKEDYFVNYVPYYYENMNLVANENKLYKNIFKNNQIQFFSNSYFVELSNDKSEQVINYAKYNNEYRNDSSNVVTILDDNNSYKMKLNEKADYIINEINEIDKILEEKEIEHIEVKKTDNGIYTKLLSGELLSNKIKELYLKNDIKSIEEYYDRIYDIAIKSLGELTTNNIFNDYGIKVSQKNINKMKYYSYGIIDMIPSNIIIENNKMVLFDQEWKLNNIPVEYIMHKSIGFLKEIDVDDNFIHSLYEKYNIDEELLSKIDDAFYNSIHNKSFEYYLTYYKNYRVINNIKDSDLLSKTIDKMNKTINEQNNIIHDKDVHIRNIEAMLSEREEHISNIESELRDKEIIEEEYNSIINSKRWKLINKVMNIKSKKKIGEINMKKNLAIKVTNMTKTFKLYSDKPNTLKEKLVRGFKNKTDVIKVLNNINLEIEKGETVALIGVNGSGKSTLLKLMTKIIYPNKGSVEVNGKLTSLLELGAGFHPDFTGRENIYFNASIFGLTKKEIDARINDIIAFSELGDFIDTPIRTYSSGMYMRLAFSVAINVDAEILLIDEILAVGDQHFQDKCFEKLKELSEGDTTIVIVSHSLDPLRKLCKRGVWINEGKIVMDSKIDKVIDSYLEKCS